jgi:exopolyphosphatase / guanosine-5'-triphosphate,3'-diphosphate pyrophosphatase
LKLAAIDIGSNAIRLLISTVYEMKGKVVYRKIAMIRVPIRLGEDVFSIGKISKKNTELLILAMQAFSNLMQVHEVQNYRACATSAMRDASNRDLVIKEVAKNSAIQIETIDGKTEAALIFNNHLADTLAEKNAYLYIDVGGGSTELTLTFKNKKIVSQSFNLGTIRLLKNKVDDKEWIDLKTWVKKCTKEYKPLLAIGTGGNINKIYRLAKGKNSTKVLTLKRMKEVDVLLNSFSLKERIEVLELNPDRADVIIPASKIFLTVMKTAGINSIIVPQLGLSDGIIRTLYETQ